MLTTCKQNLDVAPWRWKFSRDNVLFIVMFTFVMVQSWNIGVCEYGIICCTIFLFIPPFWVVKIHWLFRIMLLIQWSVIISIFLSAMLLSFSEIPKHAGPMDKSGKNQFGPEKHWFPPDRLSGMKYCVCCIKEPCLITNLSIFYFG
jgi:hypothetical protein